MPYNALQFAYNKSLIVAETRKGNFYRFLSMTLRFSTPHTRCWEHQLIFSIHCKYFQIFSSVIETFCS